MPRSKPWVVALLVISLSVMGLGLSAAADAGQENEFLAAINSSRTAAGLAPLAMSGGLQTYARSHSIDMANANQIYHSTSAQLAAAAGSGWTNLGENVGRGPGVAALHSAFMGSSGHKANILGDYNYVGIGTTTKDGYIYVTAVFMKKGATTAAAPTTTTTVAKSSPPPDPAPTTSTTSTTLPPTTTTTTLVVPPDREVVPGTECLEATRFWQKCHD
ncbi:MAG: CAP domain-containing protein [Acidimicrobiia bacterium]